MIETILLELFPFVVLNGFLYRGRGFHTWADQLLPQLLMVLLTKKVRARGQFYKSYFPL